MKWSIRLLGNVTDLEFLREHLCVEGLELTKYRDNYHLFSETFACCQTASEVRRTADGLIKVLSGLSGLALGFNNSIDCGLVMEWKDDGTKMTHMEIRETLPLRDSFVAKIIETNSEPPGERVITSIDLVNDYLPLALQDPDAEKLLRLYGTGDFGWVNLYRMYETMESSIPQASLVELGWATSADLRLFKHTANHPGATGDEARHGRSNEMPPSSPMRLLAAKNLIDGIIRQWLALRKRNWATGSDGTHH